MKQTERQKQMRDVLRKVKRAQGVVSNSPQLLSRISEIKKAVQADDLNDSELYTALVVLGEARNPLDEETAKRLAQSEEKGVLYNDVRKQLIENICLDWKIKEYEKYVQEMIERSDEEVKAVGIKYLGVLHKSSKSRKRAVKAMRILDSDEEAFAVRKAAYEAILRMWGYSEAEVYKLTKGTETAIDLDLGPIKRIKSEFNN